MSSNLTALVDADNFYVSCERIFKPALQGRPVAVLSNNDGCVVARSRELKDMGVKMGIPWFQIPENLKKRITVFSSNYELYGDISNRLMNVLREFSAETEVYSIDEAFLRLDREKSGDISREIIQTCLSWLGIPVKVGISHTKTLAKVAAELVKQENSSVRYKMLVDEAEIDEALKKIPLEDIWGLGRKTVEKLKRSGMRTPFDLKKRPEKYIHNNFGVVVARTATELRGKSCFQVEDQPKPPKNLCYSKSFSRTIADHQELREAVSSYASGAAAKLRKQHSAAQSVSLFIITDRFKAAESQYYNSATLSLTPASNDTLAIVKAALTLLVRIFKPGCKYKKCGVLLNDLIPEEKRQQDLFIAEDHRNKAISKTMDAINRRYGADSIVIAASGIKHQDWGMSRRYQSPRYTTQWNELLQVKY